MQQLIRCGGGFGATSARVGKPTATTDAATIKMRHRDNVVITRAKLTCWEYESMRTRAVRLNDEVRMTNDERMTKFVPKLESKHHFGRACETYLLRYAKAPEGWCSPRRFANFGAT
jgi:hypothetical protein